MQKLNLICLLALAVTTVGQAGMLKLESDSLRVDIDETTGRWMLLDKRSQMRWPSQGLASPGRAEWLGGGFDKTEAKARQAVHLGKKDGTAVAYALVDKGNTLELRYEDKSGGTIRVLDDVLVITDAEGGYAIVPCREGLMIPADSGKCFGVMPIGPGQGPQLSRHARRRLETKRAVDQLS